MMKALVVPTLSLILATSSAVLLSACGDGSSEDGGAGGESSEGSGGSSSGGSGNDDYEAPSNCKPLLDPLVGQYEVTDAAADHDRGTIFVHPSGAIDFDTDISFEASDIQVCYDRTKQDHDRRVHVSYGADDNGRVINIYLSEDLIPTEIQYRHLDESIDIRVPVGPVGPIE